MRDIGRRTVIANPVFVVFSQNADELTAGTPARRFQWCHTVVGHANSARGQRNAMPELSPGGTPLLLLLLLLSAAAGFDDDETVDRSITGGPVAATDRSTAIPPTTIALLAVRRPRVTSHDDDDHDDHDDDDNDVAEDPTDRYRPTVLRKTVRRRAHGARLSVNILLHALSEFADHQVRHRRLYTTICSHLTPSF